MRENDDILMHDNPVFYWEFSQTKVIVVNTVGFDCIAVKYYISYVKVSQLLAIQRTTWVQFPHHTILH